MGPARRIADLLRPARRIAVLSGAGLSAASGIPTFRDPGGVWERFDPERFSTATGLLRTFAVEPDRLREFALAALSDVAAAEPNAGHRAIARLGELREVHVATQNVDGLHQAAGSTNVYELHGSLYEFRGLFCGHTQPLGRDAMRAMVEQLREPLGRHGGRRRLLRMLRPMFPRCAACGRRMRTSVVFFGEMLPVGAWSAAEQAARTCDAMLVVGTSASVYPAAMLPQVAAAEGKPVAAVTVDPSFRADWAAEVVVGAATEMLPAIVAGCGAPVA